MAEVRIGEEAECAEALAWYAVQSARAADGLERHPVWKYDCTPRRAERGLQMTRGNLFRITMVALLIAGIVAGIIWYPSGPRPCLATFKQVKVGMTRAEVVAILGRPPGDYTTREWSDYINSHRDINYERWICDEGFLCVRFGENNYPATPWPPEADDDPVTDVAIKHISFHESTFFERIRRWLGL